MNKTQEKWLMRFVILLILLAFAFILGAMQRTFERLDRIKDPPAFICK